MGKKGKKGQRRSGGSGGSGAASPRKFTAPTPGLEDVIFTWGTAKDAPRFEETVSSLVRHIGTQGWKHSSVVSKAMSRLALPVIVAPDRPVREYWANPGQTIRTNNAMSSADPPVALVSVKEYLCRPLIVQWLRPGVTARWIDSVHMFIMPVYTPLVISSAPAQAQICFHACNPVFMCCHEAFP